METLNTFDCTGLWQLFGRCSSTLRGTPEMPASSFGGRAEASATTGPSADPDLTYMSPVIFARRTPEERRRDELGVLKILEYYASSSLRHQCLHERGGLLS
jgi:hypothetical protein